MALLDSISYRYAVIANGINLNIKVGGNDTGRVEGQVVASNRNPFLCQGRGNPEK
jgi:hypothetical protein